MATIGTCWATGSWATPAWAASTWAGAGASAAIATGKYQPEWASAYADIAAAGASLLTFTKTTKVVNAGAATLVPTDTTTTGAALEVEGSIQRYQALGLSIAKARTLLFVPGTYALGTEPPLGAAVTWGGEDFTVEDVHHRVAPDGFLIACRVVIAS